ncbi:rhsD element protein, partial [Escherichia coli O104:H4 str. E112/10]
GIKNPRAAQPALHKISLCGEYCLIKNPRSSSRKTRVCSHAPDAHTPRKTNFLLISFLNQVVMF